MSGGTGGVHGVRDLGHGEMSGGDALGGAHERRAVIVLVGRPQAQPRAQAAQLVRPVAQRRLRVVRQEEAREEVAPPAPECTSFTHDRDYVQIRGEDDPEVVARAAKFATTA